MPTVFLRIFSFSLKDVFKFFFSKPIFFLRNCRPTMFLYSFFFRFVFVFFPQKHAYSFFLRFFSFSLKDIFLFLFSKPIFFLRNCRPTMFNMCFFFVLYSFLFFFVLYSFFFLKSMPTVFEGFFSFSLKDVFRFFFSPNQYSSLETADPQCLICVFFSVLYSFFFSKACLQFFLKIFFVFP